MLNTLFPKVSEDDCSSTGDVSCAMLTTSNRSEGASSQDDAEAENRYFGHDENRKVRKLKILVFLVLFLVTLVVCMVTFSLTAQGQQAEFEASFSGSALRVIKSFEDILQQKIAAIAAFGVTITASALETNSTWPFVTVNRFQERSASTRSLSAAMALQVLPVITDETRADWERYCMENDRWVVEGMEYQMKNGLGRQNSGGPPNITTSPTPPLLALVVGVGPVVDPGPGPYYPTWQKSPILSPPWDSVNVNLGSLPQFRPYLDLAASTGQVALGGLDTSPAGDAESLHGETALYATTLSFEAGKPINYTGEPFSNVFIPVMDSFEDESKTAALLYATIRWSSYFKGIFTDADQPVDVVLSNTCDGAFTYEIRGEKVIFMGEGNRADRKYQDMMMSAKFDEDKVEIEPNTIKLTLNQGDCPYTLSIYPTREGEEYTKDELPLITTLAVAFVFVMTAAVFFFYDVMVEKRQKVILTTAQRSTAIVSSIFPKKVRDQMMQVPVQGNATKLRSLVNASKDQLHEDIKNDHVDASQPIADLFPHCTVMFADVENFTAWSSVREPCQVLKLLETIYAAFDRVASRRGVFKVETVGDCYVAVCGLPDPKKNHAVVMARFARDCVEEHILAVKRLESTLGPDTGDLRIRVGLHSGPVTAGVLGVERARFQLFGDTVNTAARMEASSEGNRVHLTDSTARLISEAGHGRWMALREGTVNLKGKGTLQTFWLLDYKTQLSDNRGRPDLGSVSYHRSDKSVNVQGIQDSRKQRHISWNAESLLRIIRDIVARRDTSTAPLIAPAWQAMGTNPLHEVVEIIGLPSKTENGPRRDPNTIVLDPKIESLMKEYVSFLADMYPENPFHNFEHASHVTMSVTKLLSRIVSPSDMDFTDDVQASAQLHDHTYGITSDPLTHFACVLSALIHDVDHPGVSNTTLIAEGNKLMNTYGRKSLAEQNSVDQAWDLLMTDRYQPLVAVLCRDSTELSRLRQLVVNSVMATDIMDPDLKKLRNGRWDKAFDQTNVDNQDTSHEAINRKATIVIEHLIQASDVSHTMQHWHVYTKWNARLFKEMYKAYIDGREGAKDPSLFWAKGEIGFFDHYIIPLAKKLKECGVFGVSSDEYLQYAMSNRYEWEEKGEMIVKQLIGEAREEFGVDHGTESHRL